VNRAWQAFLRRFDVVGKTVKRDDSKKKDRGQKAK
jgi:hypothetical protein